MSLKPLSQIRGPLLLQPANHVLEIGFGPGALINQIASITTEGHVEGVDFSESMLTEATKNNKRYISSNRVKIQKGDSKELNYADETFDKICTVNTLYFWNPPKVHLSEIFRVLKSGGRLVLGLRSSEQMESLPLDKTIFNTYSLNEAVSLISNVGFSDVHIQERDGVPFASYCVVGTKA